MTTRSARFVNYVLDEILRRALHFYSVQRLDLFASCVRLIQLFLVGFERTLNQCTFISFHFQRSLLSLRFECEQDIKFNRHN